MNFLDADFFTALPAIIIGMTCMGLLYFLVFGLISKASGKSIGYRGGITYGGGTLADPDTLDKVAVNLRKLVDKKFKNKKDVEEECEKELQQTLYPTERMISTISWMYVQNFPTSSFRDMPYGNELLKYLGKDESIWANEKLSTDDKKKLKEISIDLHVKKNQVTKGIKDKYQKKLSELNNIVVHSNDTKYKSQNISSLSEEIKNLSKLYDDGIITKTEFENAKNKLLNSK